MKRKTLFLLLALVLTAALSLTALAQDVAEEPPAAQSPVAVEETAATEEDPLPEEAAPVEAATAEPGPDEAGTLSFENLEQRLHENNLTMRAVDERLKSLDSMDRKEAYDALLEAHNSMTDMLLSYSKMSYAAAAADVANPIGAIYTQMDAGYSAAYLQSQQAALLEQLENLKEEEYQKTYDEAVWQMDLARDQITFGVQTLYITTLSLERTLADGQRGLAALDRRVTEFEKRYELGQISQLTLLELKNTRTQTASSLTTLSLQIERLKAQLNTFVGVSPFEPLTLKELPSVSAEQIAALRPEEDSAAAKEKSFNLYSLEEDVKDAQEKFEDSADGYPREMARHNYNAAVYSRDAAIQSFELSFFNLARTVTDNAQLLEAAISALELEQKNFEAARVKFDRGLISENAFLDAADTLAAARSKVQSCSDNLFSAYNNYLWAQRGIVNE